MKRKKYCKTGKILFVSHETGTMGATLSMISLISGLKENNSDLNIEVILPFSFRGKSKRKMREKNIKYKEVMYRHNFRRLDISQKIMERIYNIINFFATGWLYIYMKMSPISIVCSNSTAVDVGARAARLAGIPHIFYVREFMEEDHHFSYRNKKRMKKLLETSESIIFISKAVEKKYTSLYNFKKTNTFHNGFIVKDYYVPNHVILSGNKISFIQMGKLDDGKGTINTIQLLYSLKKNGILNWDMEFIGDGNEKYISKMKIIISDYQLQNYIVISNFCDKVKEKLAKKDILIMNSNSEGFGRVTVEGMLAGCLVIGRDRGGTSEIIVNNVNGIAFETDKGFLDAVKDILKDRVKYRDLASEGQRLAMGEYDNANVAKEFMKVIKNVYEISK